MPPARKKAARKKGPGLPRGATHSVLAVAEALDMNERNVQRLVKEGVLPRATHGKYDVLACVHAYIGQMRGELASYRSSRQGGSLGGGRGLDLAAERARLAHEQADAQRMKNEAERGEVIAADEVLQLTVALCATVRTRLLAVPTALASRLSAEGEPWVCQEMLRTSIEEALNELARAQLDSERRAADGRGAAGAAPKPAQSAHAPEADGQPVGG